MAHQGVAREANDGTGAVADSALQVLAVIEHYTPVDSDVCSLSAADIYEITGFTPLDVTRALLDLQGCRIIKRQKTKGVRQIVLLAPRGKNDRHARGAGISSG